MRHRTISGELGVCFIVHVRLFLVKISELNGMEGVLRDGMARLKAILGIAGFV